MLNQQKFECSKNRQAVFRHFVENYYYLSRRLDRFFFLNCYIKSFSLCLICRLGGLPRLILELHIAKSKLHITSLGFLSFLICNKNVVWLGLCQMYEEMAVLSPLVATREFCELRYCQMIEHGSWIVVNVSYHLPQFVSQSSNSYKFPSGCLIQDMPNGYSKVWFFFCSLTNLCFMLSISIFIDGFC